MAAHTANAARPQLLDQLATPRLPPGAEPLSSQLVLAYLAAHWYGLAIALVALAALTWGALDLLRHAEGSAGRQRLPRSPDSPRTP